MPKTEITQLAPPKRVKAELVKRPSHSQIALFIKRHGDRLLFGAFDKVELIYSKTERRDLVALGRLLETQYADMDWFSKLHSQAALLDLVPILVNRVLKLVLTTEIETKVKNQYEEITPKGRASFSAKGRARTIPRIFQSFPQTDLSPYKKDPLNERLKEKLAAQLINNTIRTEINMHSFHRDLHIIMMEDICKRFIGPFFVTISVIGHATSGSNWTISSAILATLLHLFITLPKTIEIIKRKKVWETKRTNFRQFFKDQQLQPEEIVKALMVQTKKEQRFLIKELAPLIAEGQEVINPNTMALASLPEPE